MLMPITTLIFILVANPVFANKSKIVFNCQTVQFGERAPINLLQIKPESLKDCGEFCAREDVYKPDQKNYIHPVPEKWINQKTEFNPHLNIALVSPKNKKTNIHQIKKSVFIDPAKKVHILETRYVTYPQSPLKLYLNCDEKNNCEGSFEKSKKNITLSLDQKTIEDSRPQVKSIKAELGFGPREKSRLIIRIYKDSVTHNTEKNFVTSSSGEVVLSQNKTTIEIDVGTDEQLKIYDHPNKSYSERLAAAEFKLICEKEIN